MAETTMPASISFAEQTGEKLHVALNGWAVLYILMALFWCYMAYTEVTGKWITMPEKMVDAVPQRVPIEQPEGQKDD